MHVGDQVPPSADWLGRELRQLRRDIEELRAERSLQSSTIGAGGLVIDGGTLVVRHVNGFELLAIRKNSFGHMVVVIKRDNGTTAFSIEEGFGQYWSLRDTTGNIVVSDDVVSGDGLARPWVDIPFYRIDSAPPTNSGIGVTQGGTFTGIYEAHTHRQHPYLEARMYVTCSADGVTVGEGRLKCDGTVIGTTVVTAAGGGKVEQQVIRLPSGSVGSVFGQQHQLNYELRRTAGAGNVYGFVAAWWRQT